MVAFSLRLAMRLANLHIKKKKYFNTLSPEHILMKFAIFGLSASVDIRPWCMGRGAPRCRLRGPGP